MELAFPILLCCLEIAFVLVSCVFHGLERCRMRCIRALSGALEEREQTPGLMKESAVENVVRPLEKLDGLELVEQASTWSVLALAEGIAVVIAIRVVVSPSGFSRYFADLSAAWRFWRSFRFHPLLRGNPAMFFERNINCCASVCGRAGGENEAAGDGRQVSEWASEGVARSDCGDTPVSWVPWVPLPPRRR